MVEPKLRIERRSAIMKRSQTGGMPNLRAAHERQHRVRLLAGRDWHFRLESRGGALKSAHLLTTCLWLKQHAKTSLLKVAVAGERFQEVALLHDDEADAVDCSPPFIRALTIKLPAFSAQL